MNERRRALKQRQGHFFFGRQGERHTEVLPYYDEPRMPISFSASASTSASRSPGLARHQRLQTPPIGRVVPEGVFDAFGWCESDWLEWRHPVARDFDTTAPIDGSDPARMVFVFHCACTFLPQELARFHAFGMGLCDELALAPYAIDDATDALFERNVQPRSLLWLAADNLNALFWGLHDWAHFHNHGPFEQRAWTELQCDAAAFWWLTLARTTLGLDDEALGRVRAAIEKLARARFEGEGLVPPRDLADRLAGRAPAEPPRGTTRDNEGQRGPTVAGGARF